MKKGTAFILAVLFMLLMTACQTAEHPEITLPYVPETTSASESAAPVQTEETTVPEVTAAFAEYAFIHTDKRDLKWEEDIVYLAQMYLGEGPVKGHAKLVNEWYSVCDIDDHITTRYFYDETLRETFIAEVNALISCVPDLTDSQITYGLLRIVALLGDAHSSVSVGIGELFPIAAERMEQDGKQGLYVIRIPARYSQFLYRELTAINGIDIEEVCSRLKQYISSENEYWADEQVHSIFYYCRIADKAALQAAGVVPADADTAVFTFRDPNGNIEELELEALGTGDEYWSESFVNKTAISLGMLYMSQYGECNYFGSWMPEYDTFYIRLYQMREATDYRLGEFLLDQNQQIRNLGGVKKLVLDVRSNPGGYTDFADEIVSYLRETDAEQIYILMDGGSFSCAVIFPYRASQKLDNVTLVGTPAGQPPNFFAGSSSVYSLNNHDVSFTISKNLFECDGNYEGDAVMPDVTVYQNLSDYMQGIDTQLQLVLDMEVP